MIAVSVSHLLGSRLGMVLSLILSASVARADFQIPKLTGPIVDQSGMLRPAVVDELDISLRRLRDTGGPQINVLIVKSLEGLPIEEASIRVTDEWKLGGQKADDGVLLLISTEDRRLRIEVGQGLEGNLTDLDSKRIIEEVMTPYLRAGRASDAVIAGLRAIIARVAPDSLAAFGNEPRPMKRVGQRGGGLPLPLLILIFIVLAIIGRRGGGRGFVAGLALGALTGRGGWSGGGRRDGGGWSGGGGGFSGGGASGGW